MDNAVFKRGLIVFLVCLIVFSVWGVQWKTCGSEIESWENLQPGDILFVDIYDGWCHGGYWDHIAIYVGQSSYLGSAVVEATFNAGIIVTPVREFFNRDKPAKIDARRLKGEYEENEEIIQKAIEYALEQVGKPFDYSAHTTTVPHKLKEGNLHCTEIVWRAYKAAGIDIDGNDFLFVYPDDIYFSSKLEPV